MEGSAVLHHLLPSGDRHHDVPLLALPRAPRGAASVAAAPRRPATLDLRHTPARPPAAPAEACGRPAVHPAERDDPDDADPAADPAVEHAVDLVALRPRRRRPSVLSRRLEHGRPVGSPRRQSRIRSWTASRGQPTAQARRRQDEVFGRGVDGEGVSSAGGEHGYHVTERVKQRELPTYAERASGAFRFHGEGGGVEALLGRLFSFYGIGRRQFQGN